MGLSVSAHYLNVAVTGIQFGVYEEYALDDFPVGFLAVGENDKLIETRRSFPFYTLRTRTHTHTTTLLVLDNTTLCYSFNIMSTDSDNFWQKYC